MTQAEVKAHIERNLIAAGLPIEDLRVQPDIFLGWLIVVVSSGFAGMVWEKRLAIALQGLEEEIFQWRDLLTPEEREVAGTCLSTPIWKTFPCGQKLWRVHGSLQKRQ